MSNRLAPETDPALLAPYQVDGSSAVDTLIRSLIRRRTVVTLFGDTDPFSTVLESYDGSTLDVAISRSRQDAIESERLVAVSLVDDVKIQLSVRPRELVVVGGELRLRLERPSTVHRVQRRDGFRVKPRAGDPGLCHVRTEGGKVLRLPVLDVSVVGVALAVPRNHLVPAVGARLSRCQLHIVEDRLIPCDLVVRRHAVEPQATRIGCQIEPLSVAAAQSLQRTVMEIELTR
jgi:hypothetical protein